MAQKRYQLTFTDTSHTLINSLERRGFSVRDILNAGVVLFDEAEGLTRARAMMIANNDLREEVRDLERRLAAAKAFAAKMEIKISPSDGSLEKLTEALGPEVSHSKKAKTKTP
jgi:hypothetical protein